MISSKKALESAQTLSDFCKEQKGCQNCIFREFGSDSWKCIICVFDLQEVILNIEAKNKNRGYL